MGIVNRSTVYDEKVDLNRSAIGHRATWMGLTYQEMKAAGIDGEMITRAAIKKKGEIDGNALKEKCDPTDLTQFAEHFVSDVVKSTFQMDFTEVSKDDCVIEFHYCPLVAAWKKLGYDDELCAKLCDMAMDGDRAIASAAGIKLDLTKKIADGCDVCHMHWHK
ncbi:L-2-amino-thiazoline-4-carboxylic acid hydrolase [Oribacterium sp. WCC10]|uniref:L-2-amino-thiazoline-4-carboxylic acid hydrolase n=1 Tax=Oribacterium sp. WCC10 TaxID=1855343 RepID=UPI0008E0C3AB|nr:L-2-amino-thiazoline-4-carboxylic acid hydrolase [Oribacterium sp. WCC10]SFG62518.1 L-2-amino-thiazoline-4-carboxylic acid hydrolase [Oribacterium sp. WCC10]